jgi:hypothetical protein
MVGSRNSPPLLYLGAFMPVKYKILSSHADAKPKAGTKTSNYPKGKKSKGVEGSIPYSPKVNADSARKGKQARAYGMGKVKTKRGAY